MQLFLPCLKREADSQTQPPSISRKGKRNMAASGLSAIVNSSLQDLICQLLILAVTQSHQLQTVSGAGPVGVGIFSKKGSQLGMWDPHGKAWPCKGKVG